MRIVFRTTASKKIGSGHIMRCLALADLLCIEEGVIIEFVTQKYSESLDDIIKKKGFILHSLPIPTRSKLEGLENYALDQDQDANDTIKAIIGKKIDWLIIDHYLIDYKWEEKLRPHSRNIMVIDDLANRRHNCDLLLDQNYINDQKRYDDLVSPDTIKLLGPRYALLRKDFFGFRNKIMQNIKKVKKVFIFFGGADSDNLTSSVLKVLSKKNLRYLNLDVVIGSLNPHIEEVRLLVAEHSNAKLHIQVDNIAALMSKADISLGAGGTANLERMSVGLPSIVVTIAENQVAFASELNKDGYIKFLGGVNQVNEKIIKDALQHAILNPQQLDFQSKKCKTLVDGYGVQRVSELLIHSIDAQTLFVREANNGDCQLYWHWANDPLVRENAFQQEQIALEDHQIWFKKQLNYRDVIMMVIESEFGPVAQVRFDRANSNFTVNYSIARQFRGFGLGKAIISKAINCLREPKSFTVIAEVKESNISSQKIFENVGFNEVAKSLKYNQQVYTYQLQISLNKLH